MSDYYFLNSQNTNPGRVKRERQKARDLRRSPWWLQKIQTGTCHYCGEKVPPRELTMDHIVPLARGGSSTKGNLVPSCSSCNKSKNLKTPVEEILDRLSQ